MGEDKKKKEKRKPLEFVIFLKKGTKKELTTTLYKKYDWEIMKYFSGNMISYINTIMHALSYNIKRVEAKGIIYFEVYATNPILRRCWWQIIFFPAVFMLLKSYQYHLQILFFKTYEFQNFKK